MPKPNEMKWCFLNLFLKLFMVTVLLQYSLCYDILDADKHQELDSLSRLGRANILTTLDDRSLKGGLIAYPRLGRQVWELAKTLIPYPRAGRLIVDPEFLDYDILLTADNGSPALEDLVTYTFLNDHPVVHKRRNAKLIPRIGRKKRSIPDEQKEKEHTEEYEKEATKSESDIPDWDSLDNFDKDYLFMADKKGMMSKSAFAPRIGKKRTDYLSEYLENKRAAAFTPRIGRAFIPRIGRNDPRFRLKNRASFIPRIGRRAALIPRIGRSENSQNSNADAD